MLDEFDQTETQTPYAYAFGMILTFMSQTMTELDKTFMEDVVNVCTHSPSAVPQLKQKYIFTMEKMITLYKQISEGFDMAIPDEEKLTLNAQFQQIQGAMKEYLKNNN